MQTSETPPASAKKRRGPKPKPESERRRHNQTVRIREATRAALIKEADRNQRSLSEEMESRLEQSLSDELGGNTPTAMLLRSLGRSIQVYESVTKARWWEDEKTAALAYGTAAQLLKSVLWPHDHDPDAQPVNRLLSPLYPDKAKPFDGVANHYALEALDAMLAWYKQKEPELPPEQPQTEPEG